jgi:GntR family transcriptional regulator
MTLVDLGRMRRYRPGSPTTGSEDRSLLYERVIDIVEQIIVEQQLGPGDLLPTQAELCELAGVSRITVTRALAELEREGRVRRHQGVGTFLARPRFVSEPERAGSLFGTLSSGTSKIRVGTRVLSLAVGSPSPDLLHALGLEEGARVWRLHRLRLLEGQAMVVETSVIPVERAPDLGEHYEELTGSLYELLERHCSLKDVSEEQFLEVVLPTDEQRRLLHLSAHTSVVRIRGISIEASGRPFDCFEQVYPAADFVFYLSGGATGQLLVNSATKDWSVSQLESCERGVPGSEALSEGTRSSAIPPAPKR